MPAADRNLYLNADKSAVVEEGSPDAAFLLVAAGCEAPDDELKRLGLELPAAKGAKHDDEAKPAPKADAKPAAAPAKPSPAK